MDGLTLGSLLSGKSERGVVSCGHDTSGAISHASFYIPFEAADGQALSSI